MTASQKNSVLIKRFARVLLGNLVGAVTYLSLHPETAIDRNFILMILIAPLLSSLGKMIRIEKNEETII